jgi:hypothetical protein
VRRFRLSTLMLLIVIAGLTCALWIQQRRGLVREQQFQLERAQLQMQLIRVDTEREYSRRMLESRKRQAAARESAPESPVSASDVPFADKAP